MQLFAGRRASSHRPVSGTSSRSPRGPVPNPATRCGWPSRIAAAVLVLAGLLAPAGVAADEGFTMTARGLLQGHVRQGAWFAIAVDIQNAGPTVTGELRVGGGVDSKTRFGTPVELATGSRKTYILYAQPPTFGGSRQGPARQRRPRRGGGPGRHRAPRPGAARGGRAVREPGEDRQRAQAPAQRDGRRGRDRHADRRRPPRPAPGLGGPRPPRVAGRRRLDPHARPDGRAARLDRRRRPAGHRRRHRRGGLARGLPRRPAPLPPDRRPRHRPVGAPPDPGRRPGQREDADRVRRRRRARATRSRPPATA